MELESSSSHNFVEHPPAVDSTSPSLRNDHDGNAFEIKFLLPFAVAKEVLDRARRHMQLDPHCEPQLGEAYEVHGLYFDTNDFHVYHRLNSHAVHKLRLRRYGRMPSVFLEHKAKVKGRVRKHRTPLEDDQIPMLVAPRLPEAWTGSWFRKRLKSRRLHPTCEVSYLRTAFMGSDGAESFRLTIDRHLRCRRFVGWDVRGVDEGIFVLENQMIMELKFCDAMPLFFKNLLADLKLAPESVSKYRMSVEACGLVVPAVSDALPMDTTHDKGADENALRSA